MSDETPKDKDSNQASNNSEDELKSDQVVNPTGAGVQADGSQQQIPPSIQFRIPLQNPQLQMPLQVPAQVAAQNVAQTLPNVQALADSIKESTKEGNASEAQIPSQIILIASAILVIVGVLALSSDHPNFSIPVKVLLLLAVFGLGTSLLVGVVHFATERRFWYKNREKATSAFKMLEVISNSDDRDRAAAQALIDLDPGSNRIPLWVQLGSFMIGILSLLILIIAKIIVKT